MGGGRWREERKKNPLSLYLGAGNSAGGGDLPSALELPSKEPASPGGLGSKVPVDVTRRQADRITFRNLQMGPASQPPPLGVQCRA